ncbi:MAG: LEA type 2 family protein [Pseudomonadota bacterium]
MSRSLATTISAAFLLALVLAVTGCANVGLEQFDDPEIELLAIEPMAARGMEARFLVRLRIVNPNPISLDIDGLAYDVFLRDSKVLSGASNEAVSIDAYGEGEASLEVAAGMLGTLALIRDLITNPPEAGIPYRLNAKISRKGLGGSLRVKREGVLDPGQGLR